MIISRILRGLWRNIRLLFHFKKPGFQEVELFGVVVAEYPLAIFSWKMKRRYFIKILEAKWSSDKKSGTHLIKLPAGLTELTIILRSTWRKTKFIFPLHAIELEDPTLIDLFTTPQQNRLPLVSDFEPPSFPKLISRTPVISTRFPTLRTKQVRLNIDPFIINQSQPNKL